jgi:anaerobic selenocysteine-containing dehydrogenase
LPTQQVPTLCKICDEHCGILVADDGQKATITGNREHPISKGFVCVKGKNFNEVHHSPHRLKQPLLKTKSGWEQVSFDDALDILSSNLLRCKKESGSESVVFYKGEGLKHFEIAQYMRHLANGFGSPNYVSVGSLCHYAQVLGHSLTYGGKPVPDFERIRVALVWGANPAVSSPRTFGELKKATRNGVKLVVIDPSVTKTSEQAHVHLRPKPGSDGFLAIAFMKYAIEMVGFEPIDDFTEGWKDLVTLVNTYSYEDLVKHTGLTKAEFSEAGSLIFDNVPGWTTVGLGLEHRPGGVQTIRAVACLQSMLDPENRPAHMAARLKPLPGTDRYPPMNSPIGAHENVLFTKGRREGQGMLWDRAILDETPYPVKAMLIAGGNPMVTFPSVLRQGDALQKLDFLAVFDLFMTPTARLANLVFPAADHLDNMELHEYGRVGSPYLGLMRPATLSPIGWPTWKLVFELAQRFDMGDLFPWKDNNDAITYRLSETGVTLSDLENSPSATAAYEYQQPSNECWHTGDGTIHYRSNELLNTGDEALPVPESVGLPYETDETFPFWLSTGDRASAFQHGRFREIPAYRSLGPDPMVEIHPDAADGLGIRHGDLVIVATKYGNVEIRANLSTQVRKDSLRMTHGWEEASANLLTGMEYFDSISGFPWLRALPAKIERKGM